MTASIPTNELYRINWNALLFTDKASPTGPVVEFKVEADLLTVRSADNYSCLTERFVFDDPTSHAGTVWYMQQSDLKDLSKKLNVEQGTFDVLNLLDLAVPAPHPGAWQELDYVGGNIRPINKADYFAFAGGRWRLPGRVRSGGDYPVVGRLSELPSYDDDGTEVTPVVVEFKVGPNIRGYIMSLEPAVVEEEWRL